jgi:hypothetical protein
LEEQEKHIEIQQVPQMKNENENEILYKPWILAKFKTI